MSNNSHMLKSIEQRILFSLIIIGFVPLAISFIFNNIIFADSLLKLEKENLYAASNQTKTIIDEKLNEIGTVTRDYSVWDEPYEKIAEKDQEWFKENFSTWIPKNFSYDLSVVINKDKELIDGFGLKNDDVRQLLGNKSISSILDTPYYIGKEKNARGIIMYAGEPYLFYANPILNNYYKGEPRGILILGKRISSEFIEEIESRIGNKLFITLDDKIVHNDKKHTNIDTYIKANNLRQDVNSIKFVNNELMGSTNLDNIPDGVQAKLTIVMQRNIFMKTSKTLNISSGLIIGLSFICIFLMSLLLKRRTIMPLKRFENQIYKMSQHNVVSYVETEGPEEIEKLTEAFNKMVNKINEQSIENQNLRSELEYDRLKSEFLTNVSHEFKTPLNVILGAVQLIELYLEKDPADNNMYKSISKNIHVMKQNCYRLLRLINNLIDITKIRSDAYSIHLKNYNIISLVEDITLSVAEYTESKGIFVGFDTDTEEKIMACDPDQIERIILNLLSNSIKFTNPGGEIWVTLQDKEDSLIISVKDNGVGIPEDQLEIIFERFIQVDRSLTRNHEGSGIGLSLVKSLIEMHEGTIHVISEYGKGSEFIIELPVKVLPETIKIDETNSFAGQNKVERINIEFSDIYSG